MRNLVVPELPVAWEIESKVEILRYESENWPNFVEPSVEVDFRGLITFETFF